MKYVSRDEIKKYGIMRFFRSIKFSIEGLAYAYRYEQSMWVHAIATTLTVILGLVFKIKLTEWAILFIALGIILGMELVNTAIEAAVDLTTLEINPLAKIAKDCGSAASFVLSFVAIVICLFVFGPYFVALF